jgi:predicted Mrr-cat superfamily restriction endonuclease
LCRNSTASANASKLANSDDVIKRVEELKIKKAEKDAMSVAPPLPLKKQKVVDVDLDWFNREYIQLLNIAKENQDVKNAVSILKDMAELNKIRPEPEDKNNNNRMLPSNDKSNMGNPTYIQIVNQKSETDGGSSDRPFEITFADPEPIYINDNSIDEDS